MGRVAEIGCVVCRRLGRGWVPAQVHHIAEASGLRSDFCVAGLCLEHHDPYKTGSGLHGMGVETFCKLFRVPGEIEHGLLVWVNEDLQLAMLGRLRMAVA
jgi:hypothetical protein